jgi:hypothetical protein
VGPQLPRQRAVGVTMFSMSEDNLVICLKLAQISTCFCNMSIGSTGQENVSKKDDFFDTFFWVGSKMSRQRLVRILAPCQEKCRDLIIAAFCSSGPDKMSG